ncbi:MAG TPA: sulfatase-like hydrolase/transferase, partial [Candidatus Hydrogenedentes bacterium]|nr:sulfatase-like hydrolase/transferase [Candidatus Hydrogenedentota bacterium]
YFGIPASLDMIPYVYIENDRVVEPATEHTEGGTGTSFHRGGPIAPHFKIDEVLPTLTRKAVECIDRHAKEHADCPLFLYFPLSAPHAPIVPSQPFAGKTGIGPYGDFVAECDWTVGEVLAALERNGMESDTLFIFTSDNGAAPVSDFDALYAKGHNPNYVFRGHKADIFEGGHHIPFLARWPGHIRAQSEYTGTVCLSDLMATAADITGQKLPDNAGEDSVSFLPALLGQTSIPCTRPSSITRRTVHSPSGRAHGNSNSARGRAVGASRVHKTPRNRNCRLFNSTISRRKSGSAGIFRPITPKSSNA